MPLLQILNSSNCFNNSNSSSSSSSKLFSSIKLFNSISKELVVVTSWVEGGLVVGVVGPPQHVA